MHKVLSFLKNFNSKVMWDPVIERIALRLNSWKTTLLSIGGRLTLIKTTLASIPYYYLSLFTILVSMANRIEAKLRNFVWNDLEDQHRCHLVD